MNLQAIFILAYLAITIGIGVYAAQKVKNSKDFILAGRSLPLPISTAALFATWFGSETILGSSVEFAKGGFLAVIQDPFGGALCLFLLGLVFAKYLYRMQILTFGDFYKNRYGKKMEFIAGICLIFSYFGWVAAQFVALGIMVQILFGINQFTAIVIGLVVVIIQLNDVKPIWSSISEKPDGFFSFFPKSNYHDWTLYLSAWMVVGFGSLPQQDIFQRVMSAKSEKVAIRASYYSSVLYLLFALIPLFLGLHAKSLLPDFDLYAESGQLLIPTMVSKFVSPWVQVLFFSALISAILSTASGAILAPSSILSENILKYAFKEMNDKKLLLLSRISVLIIAGISFLLAVGKPSIYALVEDSGGISLVTLFIPMVFGLLSQRADERSTLFSLFVGIGTWLLLEIYGDDMTSHFYGTIASLVAILIGMYLFPKKEKSQVTT
ncbi:Sodium-solute symporter [Leptospira biflexa serovar Patoc strain 'Patoc 1 (Ames)']|uniref:Putative sodium:solute symporter family putative membrane protein putative signal peptide n=1 Tax=Leptospira biflexa serovar Patoc (strain Patoc 1 / ATCC 23582 / Paris) TaxID=456481 RepID=B0SS76_LEPBP|nr:sodium:solute symporter family protein [Leptospira biflexa]ABZ94314.1 Sodium-solute symporter [Leptospira biflexa serovar Patoc strain 'Patoc 1 (Ames)']ABZ97966.1 Putative sodium:solute symporter family; putative membrane protein; putative signal peptide [Leptospira biflexa serovar Patoc strain 'Patoc 1 (Paris)']